MNIEQKAAAYDKALEIAKKNLEAIEEYGDGSKFSYDAFKNTLIHMFPQLVESGDENERIKNEMIEILKKEAEMFPSSIIGTRANDWIAYLEKRENQNHSEWLNELEEKLSKMSKEEFEKLWAKYDYVDKVTEELSDENEKQKIPKFREGDIIKNKDTGEIFEVSKIEIFDEDEIYYHLTNGGCICENSDKFERVEQKSIKWTYIDKEMKNLTIAFLDEFKQKGYENAVMCIDWLNSLVQ